MTTRGWGKVNPYYWANGGYADFVQWWAEHMLTEPHSTKPIEDAVAWSHDTDGPTLALTATAQMAAPVTRRAQIELAKRVRCPVLVIHGTKDKITPYADGRALAARERDGAGRPDAERHERQLERHAALQLPLAGEDPVVAAAAAPARIPRPLLLVRRRD